MALKVFLGVTLDSAQEPTCPVLVRVAGFALVTAILPHPACRPAGELPTQAKNLDSSPPLARLGLKVVPLGAVGSLGQFWRRKNQEHQQVTTLFPAPELLDAEEDTDSLAIPISRERTERASVRPLDSQVPSSAEKIEIVFTIKKLRFFDDEFSVAIDEKHLADPLAFGPFLIRLETGQAPDWEKSSPEDGAGVEDQVNSYGSVVDFQGKPVNEVHLPPGIYHRVQITWGAAVKVRGCLEKEGKSICTQSRLSPFASKKQLAKHVSGEPEFISVPSINQSSQWPATDDWVSDYSMALDLREHGKHMLNLVYPVTNALRYFEPGDPAQDLTAQMPSHRPFFYLGALGESMTVTHRSLGRVYEFSGGQIDRLPATLQVVSDLNGNPVQTYWHWQGRVWQNFNAFGPSSTQEQNSDSAALTFKPMKSGTDLAHTSLLIKGIPGILDQWQLGDTRDILVTADLNGVASSESVKSLALPKVGPIKLKRVL